MCWCVCDREPLLIHNPKKNTPKKTHGTRTPTPFFFCEACALAMSRHLALLTHRETESFSVLGCCQRVPVTEGQKLKRTHIPTRTLVENTITENPSHLLPNYLFFPSSLPSSAPPAVVVVVLPSRRRQAAAWGRKKQLRCSSREPRKVKTFGRAGGTSTLVPFSLQTFPPGHKGFCFRTVHTARSSLLWCASPLLVLSPLGTTLGKGGGCSRRSDPLKKNKATFLTFYPTALQRRRSTALTRDEVCGTKGNRGRVGVISLSLLRARAERFCEMEDARRGARGIRFFRPPV